MSSHELLELVWREVSLPQDRPHRAAHDLAMIRHDDRPPRGVTQLDMAAALRHLIEASPPQRGQHLAGGERPHPSDSDVDWRDDRRVADLHLRVLKEQRERLR